jgi:stage III sporulation protein SpoIIIAA
VLNNDILALLDILPSTIKAVVQRHDLNKVIEIILDYGRELEIRFLEYTVYEPHIVAEHEMNYILDRLDGFSYDNRAGIPGTLHRISAIRDRQGAVAGLTLRFGRVFKGSVALIQDLVDSGESILILGRPGVGKTSKLRDAARYLSDEKHRRVVVVDSSNEIGGEGIVPHIGIGRSRRMMVPDGKHQSDIMIEAVKNHTPQVIVIDEITTYKEALAARTIGERGVQLIATAHGDVLSNVISNDPLTPIIGRVKSVTLGDKAAEKLGISKTKLERESLPTFTKIVELISFDEIAIHHDTAASIDCMLSGGTVRPEVRRQMGERYITIQPYVLQFENKAPHKEPTTEPIRKNRK